MAGDGMTGSSQPWLESELREVTHELEFFSDCHQVRLNIVMFHS